MITPASNDLFIALRAFVLSLIPTLEVIQGLGNGVPMPPGEFIAITPGAQRRLRTNQSTYDPQADTRTIEQGAEYSIQVDCYGPNSGDHATELTTLFNDYYGCAFLLPYGCQPLYTGAPMQSALINGEENYEQRWTFTAVLQFNPVVTVAQEFADELDVSFANADTTLP